MGNCDVLDFLLRARSDVLANDGKEHTPLPMAIVKDEARMLKLVLDQNANVNDQSADGITPLQLFA